MLEKFASALLLSAMLTGLCSCSKTGKTEVTKIERKIAPRLLNRNGKSYAGNITFSNARVRVNPEDDDELLIVLDVTNGGDREITYLGVEADFYNRDGRKAADEGDLLAHDFGLGDNSRPIPAHSTRKAIIELDSPEDWTGGKMVITINELRTK